MKRVTVSLGAGIILLAALTLPTVRAGAQESAVTEDNLSEKIESAKTPADHQAIAAFYDKEADDAEAKAKFHHSLHKSYESLKMKPVEMWKHCDEMGKYYEEVAKQAKILAREHREMAKKAAQTGG